MGYLHVEPEFRCGVQGLGQQPSRLGGDSAFAAHNFIDALNGNLDMGRKCDLRDSELVEEFFLENFPRMDGQGCVAMGSLKCSTFAS